MWRYFVGYSAEPHMAHQAVEFLTSSPICGTKGERRGMVSMIQEGGSHSSASHPARDRDELGFWAQRQGVKRSEITHTLLRELALSHETSAHQSQTKSKALHSVQPVTENIDKVNNNMPFPSSKLAVPFPAIPMFLLSVPWEHLLFGLLGLLLLLCLLPPGLLSLALRLLRAAGATGRPHLPSAGTLGGLEVDPRISCPIRVVTGGDTEGEKRCMEMSIL